MHTLQKPEFLRNRIYTRLLPKEIAYAVRQVQGGPKHGVQTLKQTDKLPIAIL